MLGQIRARPPIRQAHSTTSSLASQPSLAIRQRVVVNRAKKRSSWLTSNNPQGHPSSASSRHSIEGRSRWCGRLVHDNQMRHPGNPQRQQDLADFAGTRLGAFEQSVRSGAQSAHRRHHPAQLRPGQRPHLGEDSARLLSADFLRHIDQPCGLDIEPPQQMAHQGTLAAAVGARERHSVVRPHH